MICGLAKGNEGEGKGMRWYLFVILCVALVLANACTRLSAAPAPVGPPPAEISTETLTDYRVVSSDGIEVGSVDGVVINTETGETQYIIVFIKDIYNYGKGAIHGPQDHYLPIPWSHIKLDATNQQLIVEADERFIKESPVFTEPPDTTVKGWDVAVELYWTE